jgi:hypothetical protein
MVNARNSLHVRAHASSLFSSPQTRRRSVRQRIPDMPFFLFSAFIAMRSQPSPVLVVAMARKGHARSCNGSAFGRSFSLTRQETDGSQTRQFQSG